MEVTLTLPFLLTCGTVLVAIATAWVVQQYTVKDLRRELDDVKTREATVAPKLTDVLDNVAALCREVVAWKNTDHQTLLDVQRKATRNTKRLDVLEEHRQRELREELLEAGVPQSLADKVGSFRQHEVSGEHQQITTKGSV